MEEHGMCWKGSPLAAGVTSHLPDLPWAGFAKLQPWVVTDGCLGHVRLKGSRLHHGRPIPPSSWPCSGVSLRALSGAPAVASFTQREWYGNYVYNTYFESLLFPLQCLDKLHGRLLYESRGGSRHSGVLLNCRLASFWLLACSPSEKSKQFGQGLMKA